MEYSNEIKLCGIVLNTNNLEKLIEILELYYPKYNIVIEIKSGRKIKIKEKEDFKKCDFTNEKIEQISIEAYNCDYQHFYLRDDIFKYHIEYEAKDEKELSVIKCVIEDWIKKAKSPYSHIIEFFHTFWLAVMVAIIDIIAMAILIWKYTTYTSIIISIGGIYLVLSVSIFPYLVRILFPKVEIDIGINTNKSCRHIIWGILVIIVIPIIIALVL